MHPGADAIAPLLLEAQTRFVIAGHSASEDVRERAGVPAIHELSENFCEGS
jgi:hypothetical protein